MDDPLLVLSQVPEEDIVSVTDMLQHQRKEPPATSWFLKPRPPPTLQPPEARGGGRPAVKVANSVPRLALHLQQY